MRSNSSLQKSSDSSKYLKIKFKTHGAKCVFGEDTLAKNTQSVLGTLCQIPVPFGGCFCSSPNPEVGSYAYSSPLFPHPQNA